MDRGFASVERIKNNVRLEMLENSQCLVGAKGKKVEVRVVNFCHLGNQSDYRLATNLKATEVSDEEVGEIYRHRWGIETLWKFFKMHLKLDKLMTKNLNGISIQIYSCLIVYMILQLLSVSPEIGDKTLDKLRYLQSFMNENISLFTGLDV